ncbi:hypothetical protein RJG79_04110 [Mycoplasmatota bacterium WC44]
MDARKFNKFAAIVVFVFGLLVASMNIYLYKIGSDFAEEYNATEWEIEFTQVNSGGFMSSDASGMAWSSYYKYYDENGRNLIQSHRLYGPYNEMNLGVFNVVETYGVVSIIVIILGVLGMFMTISKRYNFSGFLFVLIAGFYGAMQQGILNYGALIIPISCLIGAILISKSRFVDWNGSLLFTFTKDKKQVNTETIK